MLANNEFDLTSSLWLRDVAQDTVAALLKAGRYVQCEDKDLIAAPSQELSCLTAVVSGSIRVESTLNEMELGLTNIMLPGVWSGQTALLLDFHAHAERRAAGPTKLFQVDFSEFRRLANSDGSLWRGVGQLAAQWSLRSKSIANDVGLKTGKKRLAAALLNLSGNRGYSLTPVTTSTVFVNQRDLSRLANLSLSKISPHLSDLADQEHIRLEYGRIEILNIDGLQNVLDG
ncbi:MAG: Crp/Fnr family transcriptional regulator [Pseudomonadota bacterium]